MKRPVSITFPGMQPSQWIEEYIRTHVAKLEASAPELVACHVAADIPHRHHRRGNRFSVRIDLTVPGDEIAVTRASTLHAAKKDMGEANWSKDFDIEGMRKDLRLVLKEAFDVARRRLKEHRARRVSVLKRARRTRSA